MVLPKHRWALLLFLATLGAAPPLGTGGGGDGTIPLEPPHHPRRIATSPSIPGLGPRLAAKIRAGGPDDRYRFLTRGLTRRAIEAAGGVVTAQIGPILGGVASGRAIRILAPLAEQIEAPQPLVPLLDKSRAEIHADLADRGEGFDRHYRGDGAIIAAYDSGIDLKHPDLREIDGPTRVIALWDQDMPGIPPPGKLAGNLCSRETLMADACLAKDSTGHGTHVMSVAASDGPNYRGIAPEAKIAMARSDEYDLLLDTLDWFRNVSIAEGLPLVVNLSLGGHEGPHDGTSLEAQAIDALEHLVVAAAGNDGLIPVHALVRLEKGDSAAVALRFPVLPVPAERRAIVEIWGDVGLPLMASAAVVAPGGLTLAQTSSVTIGEAGVTELLVSDTATLGQAMLDPEASLNPFNGQPHIRIEVQMTAWEDAPGGPGFVVVELHGEGRVDLWVDTPPTEPAPIRFDRERVLETPNQVLGDADHTISDPATAVSAVAVAAYTTRVEFRNMAGETNMVGGTLGEIASFTSWGPTISPATTGPKPDSRRPGPRGDRRTEHDGRHGQRDGLAPVSGGRRDQPGRAACGRNGRAAAGRQAGHGQGRAQARAPRIGRPRRPGGRIARSALGRRPPRRRRGPQDGGQPLQGLRLPDRRRAPRRPRAIRHRSGRGAPLARPRPRPAPTCIRLSPLEAACYLRVECTRGIIPAAPTRRR